MNDRHLRPDAHATSCAAPVERAFPSADRALARIRPIVVLLAIGCALLAGTDSACGQASMLAVDGKPPKRAWLCALEGVPPRADEDTPMLRALSASVVEIDQRGLARLRSALRPARVELPVPALARLVLHRDAGETTLTLHGVNPDELQVRRESTRGSASIDARQLDLIAPGWRTLLPSDDRGADTEPLARGAVVALPRPYAPGEVVLDAAEVRTRFKTRSTFIPPDPERDLATEDAFVRLPNELDATRTRRSWGVLVWISPTPRWWFPDGEFGAVLDELGIVAIGFANAGNDRRITDRLQLVFDAIATASSRFTIDRERIYVGGFSGGGRCSSMLWAAYPDVFAGAIPLMGMNSWHRLPLGDGRHLPEAVPEPPRARRALAQSRRLCALVGGEDFNRDEAVQRIDRIKREGYDVRIEIAPGIPHEKMPPRSFVEDAMRWIDAPRRDALATLEASGSELLRAHDERFATVPTDAAGRAAHRASLVAITRDAPWSSAAWEAVDRLRADPAS